MNLMTLLKRLGSAHASIDRTSALRPAGAGMPGATTDDAPGRAPRLGTMVAGGPVVEFPDRRVLLRSRGLPARGRAATENAP